MKTITKFKAIDGKEFTNKEECLKYELLIEKVDDIMALLPHNIMKCQMKTTKQNFFSYFYDNCTRKAKYKVITTNSKGKHENFCCGIHKNSILKRFPDAVVNVL